MESESQETMSLEDFAPRLLDWYIRYMERNDYAWGYVELMDRLPWKAKTLGYLEKEDLTAISVWGGNQRNIKDRMEKRNHPETIIDKTRNALLCSNDLGAIKAVSTLKAWGVSYGSKTLMFMDPLRYGVLDRQWMCPCLGLPHTEQGFVELLVRLRKLQGLIPDPGLGPDGEWRIADIQQALFQYAQEGGEIR